MPTLNALNAVENVKKRLIDFVLEDHFVKEPTLRDACQAIWGGSPEEGGLVSDLWVEGTFPNKTGGSSLAKRVADGQFSETLCNLIGRNHGFGKDWIPRSIQSESMDAALEGYKSQVKSSIVVTAGTGAGKTEAFLLPMLNELFTNNAESGQGVSAIMLYPMNALVKDQVDRLHGWLSGQDQVRLFSFTGATPEDSCPMHAHFNDGSRFSSREEARGKGMIDNNGNFLREQGGARVPGYRPPEILVTNYSMLEYMLARPQDQVFFGTNLRTIVLDEAHLYRGNLAAEIALLLRRLYLKCRIRPEDVLQFATSATIGQGGVEGDQQLKEFAAKLFTKDLHQITLIKGQVEKNEDFEREPDTFHLNAADVEKANIPQEETLTAGENPEFSVTLKWHEWEAYLTTIFGGSILAAGVNDVGNTSIAKLLYSLLPRSAAFRTLYAKLFNDGSTSRIQLETLARDLFPDADLSTACETCRRLLELGALARDAPDAMPLIPNRIHALFRAPDGLSFCFDPQGGCDKTRIPGVGFFFSPSRKPMPNDQFAATTLSVARCEDSGEWFLAGVDDNKGHLCEVPQHMMWKQDGEDRQGKAEAGSDDNAGGADFGRIIRYFKLSNGEFSIKPDDGTLGGQAQDGDIEMAEHATCPVSGVSLATRARFFSSPSRLTLSIIVESLLAEMPPFPGNSAINLPAGGRRLIAFSDSRSEASRLGPKLQEQHETQIVRAAIARALGDNASSEFVEKSKKLERKRNKRLEEADPEDQADLDEDIQELEDELTGLAQGISVTYFAARLKVSDEIPQLINDANDARDKHEPEDWPEQWNANKDAIKSDPSIKNLLARELCRRPSWPSLTTETTGLVDVVYPGIGNLTAPDAIGGIGTEQGRTELVNRWTILLGLLCDEIRNKGCITSGDDQLDQEIFCGKWVKYTGAGYGDANLCPAELKKKTDDTVTLKTRVGKFMMGVLKTTGIGNDWGTAEQILRVAFDQLLSVAGDVAYPWLTRSGTNETPRDSFRIDFLHLRFREPLTLFRCKRTGQIWTRAFASVVPGTTDVNMEPVAVDALNADPFVGRRRKEWREDRVFGLALWAEEHSAQLQVTENERIQNLFKAGIRNVLSSTTTLELGIDIGGLSGVVMGNMPPGKASYLQRAGRAGRRADGSSLVAGFARSTPYERKAFLGFGDYLDKPLPPPTVFLEREKIVRRHLHMYLLGEFMNKNLPDDHNAGAMNAFNNMAAFTGRKLPQKWGNMQVARDGWLIPIGLPLDSLSSKFEEYLGGIHNHSPIEAHQEICREIANFAKRWKEIIGDAIDDFNTVISDWCESFDALGRVWNAAENVEQDVRLCAMLRREGNSMDTAVIEEMGNGLFIPRYGFPIGVKSLKVLPNKDKGQKSKDDGRYKLERDSVMAMREYAPGSQILVSGKRITSRGILKHWSGEDVNGDGNAMLSRGHYQSGGGSFNFYEGYLKYEDGQSYMQAIFPKHGFTTATSEQPERGSKLEKVGQTIIGTNAFNVLKPDKQIALAAKIKGQLVEGGEIFVINEGKERNGFAICTRCGYTKVENESENGPANLPKKFKNHTSIFKQGGKCWDPNQVPPVLRNQMIAAKQITNLLMLDFSTLIPVQTVNRFDAENTAITVSQALRLAGADLLHLDPRELRALAPIIVGIVTRGYALVIYDSLAGGSGHVEELSKMPNDWINAAIDLLTVDGDVIDEWKKREATRRLLTSEIRDYDANFRFKPFEALQVLRAIL